LISVREEGGKKDDGRNVVPALKGKRGEGKEGEGGRRNTFEKRERETTSSTLYRFGRRKEEEGLMTSAYDTGGKI